MKTAVTFQTSLIITAVRDVFANKSIGEMISLVHNALCI